MTPERDDLTVVEQRIRAAKEYIYKQERRPLTKIVFLAWLRARFFSHGLAPCEDSAAC